MPARFLRVFTLDVVVEPYREDASMDSPKTSQTTRANASIPHAPPETRRSRTKRVRRRAIVDARSIEYIFILFIDRSDHDDDDDDDRDDDDDDDIGIVEIATRRRRARATRAEAEYWTTRRARDGHAQGTEER